MGHSMYLPRRYDWRPLHPTPATTITKLEHNVREPTRTVDMVPALANQSLLSGGKFAEAGYISICDGNEEGLVG